MNNDMRNEFIVCFYQDGETEIFKGDASAGEKVTFKSGELKRVNQEEMFLWLELAHNDNVKISIYSAKMVCDLS